jgi:hypothetical protein
MPALRMTFAHFGMSFLVSASTSSGVAVAGSKPSVSKRLCTSGGATADAPPLLGGVVAYSPLMPAALMIGHHFSISAC